jgi:twitching motility protein PilT
MARLDPLIQQMFDAQADALGIAAGNPMVLVTGAEKRPITGMGIPAEQVEHLINEILPPGTVQAIGVGSQHAVAYDAPRGKVSITMRKSQTGFQLMIASHADGNPLPAPPPPAPGNAAQAAPAATQGNGGDAKAAAAAALAAYLGKDSPTIPALPATAADPHHQLPPPSMPAPQTAPPTPSAPPPPASVAPPPAQPAAPPAAAPPPPPGLGAPATPTAPPSPPTMATPPPPQPALSPPPTAAPPPPATPATAAAPPVGPSQTGGSNALDPYFHEMIERGSSDLYICSGKTPIIRKDGDLVPLGGEGVMGVQRVRELLGSITPPDYWRQFEETNDADFAYEVKGLARFRANLFMDRRGPGGIFRQIPSEIPTAEQLGLSKSILEMCRLTKGLVLVTGPTGSGKSTTLAAMVDYINRNRQTHIITIEDPIEFVHEDKTSVINQREVHNHTAGFKVALRAALREDPDIVLVGEMRDLETVEIAIETAETGHLVFGTLHTNTAPSTVDRIIDQFPADRQAQVRTMLSEALKGVVSQTLCKKVGGGRIAAQEILVGTTSVSNLIREGKTFQIPSIMQTGSSVGMQSLNDALFRLVQAKKVTADEAYSKAVDRMGFKNLLEQNGIMVE